MVHNGTIDFSGSLRVDHQKVRGHEEIEKGDEIKIMGNGGKKADLNDKETPWIIDRFSDDCRSGDVIGTETGAGVRRKGVDKEGVLSIDNGALRIQQLIRSGWGRSGIAYGPYRRQCGLAFGVFLVNGHNTSQSDPLPDRLRGRLLRWALGAETEPPLKRIFRFMCSRQRRLMWRRLLHWIRHGTRFNVPSLLENLAVGWFPSEILRNPVSAGNAFIVRALTAECGELRARKGAFLVQAIRGLQNVPMYYIIVLRARGAAYYASSVPGFPGLAGYPKMRLLAIDTENVDETVYAGIHQSVLGEIGFRVDTRVYGAGVTRLSEFANWYGSAHGADSLVGTGPLHLSAAVMGGTWKILEGKFNRTSEGLIAADGVNTAMLSLACPSGLVHTLIKTKDRPVQRTGIIWRAKDEDNFWCFEADGKQCGVSVKQNGMWFSFPATKDHYLAPNSVNSLQVADDGENIRLSLNGSLVYETTLINSYLQDECSVGIRVVGNSETLVLQSFEAHPRDMPIPEALDLGKPWSAEGEKIVIADYFEGQPGQLDGRPTSVGAGTWRREVGKDIFELNGAGAVKVRATVEKPCKGRTAYTVEWPNPRFCDLSVKITPPGICEGMGEKGRGGVIFWEDSRNYITLSLFLSDWPAMSIAAFFYLDGYEELYDAVWSNVGRRIHWGIPYEFRVVFDSRRFFAFINGEPVLYRALTDVYPDWDRLLINRVGVVANWEWGTDTGSVFQDFVVRDRT